MGDMKRTLKRGDIDIELPGFRFHPTEEELLDFYLKNMMLGNKLRLHIIGFLNIYHHDPWDLPGLAKVGEREWYFFVPRDKKHGSGSRPNRTTERGFWKATGSDRKIISLSDPKRVIGLRKTLVFYEGRAPRGSKTDWVMNEYRLPDNTTKTSQFPNDVVLCKIYRKATSLKVLEQRAAMEHEHEHDHNNNIKKESEQQQVASVSVSETRESIFVDDNNKHQLQVQLPIITNIDWNQDPFISLINTPNSNWFSTYSPNILNF